MKSIYDMRKAVSHVVGEPAEIKALCIGYNAIGREGKIK
jgi:hypothetical protein